MKTLSDQLLDLVEAKKKITKVEIMGNGYMRFEDEWNGLYKEQPKIARHLKINRDRDTQDISFNDEDEIWDPKSYFDRITAEIKSSFFGSVLMGYITTPEGKSIPAISSQNASPAMFKINNKDASNTWEIV